MPDVHERIKQWQQRLLDLSRRNRLIYFRPSARGTLRLKEPEPSLLFQRLVVQEKPLQFWLPEDEDLDLVGGPVAATEQGEVVEASPSGGIQAAPRKIEPRRPLKAHEVLADGDPRQHGSILYRMRLRARASIEEQGVNTLFAVFGLLEWKESSASKETIRSPLILVPVQIERSRPGAPFALTPFDDDEVVLNPALVEKLRNDFGIALSHNGDVVWEDARDLAAALEPVQNAIAGQRGWRVVEEVYLGHFSFLKLAMYKDLVAHQDEMARHPLVRALAGDHNGLPSPPSDLPTAEDLDDTLPPQDTFHVLDADSSQLEALATALRGVSMIIQGPPGTGKSQTIANLIAESLASGKTVLFVSEKMAALEVVYRRLADRGLGTFCLELHSHRANKRAVIDQLARSLTDSAPTLSPHYLQTLEHLKQCRNALNAYVRRLHEVVQPLGMSAFQVHGEIAKRLAAPDLSFKYPHVGELTLSKLTESLDLVRQLTTVGDVLLRRPWHPWNGCIIHDYSHEVEGQIRVRLGRLREALCRVSELVTSQSRELALEGPANIVWSCWLAAVLRALVGNPRPPSAWLECATLASTITMARYYAEQMADYRKRRAALDEVYRDTLWELDIADLRDRLRSSRALQPLVQSRPSPHPQPGVDLVTLAVERRSTLQPGLEQTIAALDAMATSAQVLATRVGLHPPATLTEVSDLLRLVDLVLKDPRPSREWLARSKLLICQHLAEQAREHAQTCRELGGELLQHYDARLFQEAPAMARRFASVIYQAPFLRMFCPGYWRDMARLRSLRKDGHWHQTREAAAVLERASRVAASGAWFDEHTTELAVAFGHHPAYNSGPETDWDAILKTVHTMLEILDCLGSPEVPDGLARVLTGSGAALTEIRVASERVKAAWRDYRDAWAGLAELGVAIEMADGSSLAAILDDLQDWQEALLSFWDAADTVCATLYVPGSRSPSQIVADLDEAVALLTKAAEFAKADETLRSQFAHFYKGLDTDWDACLAALEWTERLRAQCAPYTLPASFISRVTSQDAPVTIDASVCREFEQVLDQVREGIEYVASLFEEWAFRPGDTSPQDAPYDAHIDWLDRRLEHVSKLREWIEYTRIRSECARADLEEFCRDLEGLALPVDQWEDAFVKRIYQLWLDHRHAAEPILARFRGDSHEKLIEEFRLLDRRVIEQAAVRVRHKVLSRRPKLDGLAGSSEHPALRQEIQILQHEANKQKRHKPLRRLFKEIPNLLLMLKPCLLMSPLSISHYLDADHIRFDLIIFDEASQVRPEDAAGAIFLASQAIVAGDSKQLPPTRFFESRLDDTDGDEDTEDEGLLDSLLDEYAARGLPQLMLRWHYRSRDERLIAFSNAHFYEHRLIAFPSPCPDAPERGVEFVHVEDGVYDRGGTRVNHVEARKVVDLIMQHAERYPSRSLGVVTFNEPQMLAVYDELDRARRARPDLEPFFAENRPEPFFVKNLETVQGDERDVIFLSIGYAKDANGRFSRNFGPLSHSGGERRLNVAVTRAREHLKLISSFLPTELDVADSSSEGVRLLRRYMEFAKGGPNALEVNIQNVGGIAESPFEEAVAAALEKRGFTVHRQVGCSGYRIDLAIVDPRHPGRYLLAIECDGASYHSSKTARDRDRLRQQVLEAQGWEGRILRIWSRDWVQDPEREIRRVLDAVQQVWNSQR